MTVGFLSFVKPFSGRNALGESAKTCEAEFTELNANEFSSWSSNLKEETIMYTPILLALNSILSNGEL